MSASDNFDGVFPEEHLDLKSFVPKFCAKNFLGVFQIVLSTSSFNQNRNFKTQPIIL
ncbi:hypothetical protein PL8927_690132 [Planktothrix serta PCC 8927]|uniref:Uncharacterized protein n=1 Tax=Planktothrix serta PCC 8927 TaxID=671068 RepID=A0A7Z9BQG5_9CYAN|nr:hypothetical protein PL8927_690132 [Planktothrix serta PCC 8927]